MSALIDRFVVWGQQLVETLGYLGLAIIMLLENAFPPVPSEPFLLGAGFTSSRGDMSIVLAIIATTLGATLGTLIYYYIGLVLPEARIRRLLRRYGRFALLGEDDLDRALAWFRRHGRPVIFFGRCIPLVRALISVPAGMTRMPFAQFLVYTVAGTAVWSSLLIVSGRLLGENYEAALTLLDRYEQVFIGTVLLAVVGFVVLRLRARRAKAKQGPDPAARSRDERRPTPPPAAPDERRPTPPPAAPDERRPTPPTAAPDEWRPAPPTAAPEEQRPYPPLVSRPDRGPDRADRAGRPMHRY